MPEAERMHSMPPTNTPTSRRRFLSAAATLAAGSAALALSKDRIIRLGGASMDWHGAFLDTLANAIESIADGGGPV